MKLMDLYSEYFWVTSFETRHETVPPGIRHKCHKAAWEIADLLRVADEVELLEEILEVAFAPGYETSMARYATIGAVLEKMGKQVNPRYAKKMADISDRAVRDFAAGGNSNAPGSASFEMGFGDGSRNNELPAGK